MNSKERPRLASSLLVFAALLLLSSSASASWKEKVLYSFQGIPDGSQPAGGVVFDKVGNLYGATTGGGSSSCVSFGECGTVYQLTPPAKNGDPWTEAVLYVFQGNAANDGATPGGGLVIDSSGNLYGSTAYGGTGGCILLGTRMGCGVVYEMTPPQTKGGQWTETVLYSFQGGKDGDFPVGNLTFDKAGNLYGATQYGGGYGSCNAPYFHYCGTVFKLSPPNTKGGKWKEKVLYSFKSSTDGANPNGGLVFDSKGGIYGTTLAGGNQNCKYDSSVGCGTAFKLKPPTKKGGSWVEKQLHNFTGGDDGGQPSAGLIFDAKGSLYGVAGGGNANGGGIVFRLTAASGGGWKETVLHWFSNDGPGPPLAGLSFDAVGDLYGTTIAGANFCGTVFRLKPPIGPASDWTLTVLYNFKGTPDGRHPDANLIFDAVGNLYSTTEGGGSSGYGTVVEVKP